MRQGRSAEELAVTELSLVVALVEFCMGLLSLEAGRGPSLPRSVNWFQCKDARIILDLASFVIRKQGSNVRGPVFLGCNACATVLPKILELHHW